MLRNISWSIITAFFQRGSLLLLSLIYAKTLDINFYGQYEAIIALVTIAIVFSSFSSNVALPKFIPERQLSRPAESNTVIITACCWVSLISLCSVILLIICSKIIAKSIYHDIGLAGPISFSTIAIPFFALSFLTAGILAGLKEYKLLAIRNCIACLISIPVAWLLSKRYGLTGAIWGYLIFGLCLSIVGIVFALFKIRWAKVSQFVPSCKEFLQIFKKYGAFGLSKVLGALSASPFLLITASILRHGEASFSQYGFFAFSYTIVMSVSFIILSVSLPFRVYYTEIITFESREDLDKTVARNIRLLCMCVVLLVYFGLAFSDNLIELVFKEESASKWNLTFLVMIMTSPFLSYSNHLGVALISAGEVFFGTFSNVMWLLSYTIVTLILSPIYASLGCAYSFFIAYFLHSMVLTIYARSKIGHDSGDFGLILKLGIIFLFVYLGLLFSFNLKNEIIKVAVLFSGLFLTWKTLIRQEDTFYKIKILDWIKANAKMPF